MAHTKAGGSTKLGRDSQSKRLGVKAHDGQQVHAGTILIRQRGSKYDAGVNVGKGTDDTLFATVSGAVRYEKKTKRSFSGSRRIKTKVSVQA